MVTPIPQAFTDILETTKRPIVSSNLDGTRRSTWHDCLLSRIFLGGGSLFNRVHADNSSHYAAVAEYLGVPAEKVRAVVQWWDGESSHDLIPRPDAVAQAEAIVRRHHKRQYRDTAERYRTLMPV